MNCSCGTECASAQDLADHKLHCMHGEGPGGQPIQEPAQPASPQPAHPSTLPPEAGQPMDVRPTPTIVRPKDVEIAKELINSSPPPKQEVAPEPAWCQVCPKADGTHIVGKCVDKPVPAPHEGDDVDFKLYKQLPPPIVKYLEETWGNWLNHFPIRRREWSKDYDDYGIEVEVPKQFSVEWKSERRQVYDNLTRRPKLDENGREVTVEIVTKDVRVINLKVGTDKVKGWLDKVKNHIISKAFQKGIKLPNTQTEYQSDISREEYTKNLHRV